MSLQFRLADWVFLFDEFFTLGQIRTNIESNVTALILRPEIFSKGLNHFIINFINSLMKFYISLKY